MKSFRAITGNKIRIGLVGCGRISANHFNAIEQNSNDLQLTAVCDINNQVLSKTALKYDVKQFTEIKKLLDEKCVDLIVLCTPSGLHSEQAIMAASHSVHVITEKPMATRWSDGLKMVKACDDAGVRLFVVKQNRHNSSLQLLKRAVSEKRFGKINLVQINVFWSRPQSYYDQDKWRGTWEFDGGALMNQASHYVDLLDWLVGPVEKVQCMVSTSRNIEVEDTGVMNIKWRNGALGSISVTMLCYPNNYEGSITILGDKGSVRVGGVAVNEIQHWVFDQIEPYDIDVSNTNYKPASVYGNGHLLYYKNVIDVIRGVREPVTDGREGLKSLELLIAAYLSARDGKSISLPLNY